MRGRVQPEDLLHDPEIEKTARENQKAVRLARSAEPSFRTQYTNLTPVKPETIIIGDHRGSPLPLPPTARPMMGDYGLVANCGHLTHVFQPANPVAFDTNTFVQQGLKENQYDGRDTMIPHEHLNHFYETYQLCVQPLHITEN